MDLATFEDGLDRHGSDLAAWPPTMRHAALALVERSAEAEAALRELRSVEIVLRAGRRAPGPADMIAARAMRHPQARAVRSAVLQAVWAGAAVAALVLGLLVGGVGLGHPESPDHVLAAALDTLGVSDVD